MDGASLLVTVTGRDRPGIAARIFEALSSFSNDPGGTALSVLDVEQVRVHGRLLLTVELSGPGAHTTADSVRRALQQALGVDGDPGPGPLGIAGTPDGLVVAVTIADADGDAAMPTARRHLVTVLAPELDAGALGAVFGRIASVGGNVDRIVRLASYPVTSYELAVTGGDPAQLRRELGSEAARRSIDVAVQRDGLHRRAKHLIVLDADSTLLRGEVIDMLAERAGCADEVAAVTEAAMAGRIEFREAMEKRLACLAGLDAASLDEVADALVLAPGARTLVRTLKRLGYVTAVVSGGFSQVISSVVSDLGIDLMAANALEVVDGRLTGRITGELIDRPGKAAALERFAREAQVPLAQTIAVGDGANDVDMLARAGLGIAFNAKPVVREAADTALSVPYLDAILFLLGISREEIEAADHDQER
ncbi:MAG: phosphoserine phosphatase SerB [Acidimicrobiales bacterium]